MLEELQIGEKEALLEYSLAPLRLRRDMAMLGLLHRINMGWAPSCLRKFIYAADGPSFPRSLRAPELRHSRQLNEVSDGTESRLFNRSVFGLVYTYNCLPQVVVDSTKVSIFQRHLQRCLKHAACDNIDEWHFLFTKGIRKITVVKFRSLFRLRN